jgi:hypothetical protein
MGMDVDIQQEEGFLNVRVTGRFSLEEANNGLIRMFEAVARHGTTRVLVDCRELQGSITTMENFDHASFGAEMIDEFSQRGVSKATRFAYVTVGAFSDPDKFAENVAVNRGLDVRTFDNIDDALRWLEIDSATTEMHSRQINS